MTITQWLLDTGSRILAFNGSSSSCGLPEQWIWGQENPIQSAAIITPLFVQLFIVYKTHSWLILLLIVNNNFDHWTGMVVVCIPISEIRKLCLGETKAFAQSQSQDAHSATWLHSCQYERASKNFLDSIEKSLRQGPVLCCKFDRQPPVSIQHLNYSSSSKGWFSHLKQVNGYMLLKIS